MRAHLSAMMASRYFSRARLEKLLLEYLVERALEGDYAALEETAIAMAVFGRGASYDPGTDGVVHLVARRLRNLLASYYGSRRNAVLRIELPKGDFVPVFVRPAGHRTRKKILRAVLATAILLAAAGAVWLVRDGAPTRRSYGSVAVLPFRNLNELPALDHYSADVAARLHDGLQKTAGLRVGPRISASDLPAPEQDIPTLARRLSVDALVKGSVLVRGGEVKIAVELVDGRGGAVLWSDVYDNPAAQIPGVEDDILYALERALKR